MISLLYHSHTIVPAHLAELEMLNVIEHDEHVLVALDGVLLDENGRRLSGPTLHDYCLITSLRVVLWARDYGQHLCCAFPLAELVEAQGSGLDPLHAQLQLRFAAPGEEDQRFTLTLLPLADLQAGLKLLRTASETARSMLEAGFDARDAGPEVIAALSEQIFGHADGPRPGEPPYRWVGAAASAPGAPLPAFYQDPASLPPGQVYAAGRLARSAWDTLRRSLREADLPFDLSVLSNGSLRDLADAVRAINELVMTVSNNPVAQQMAMSLLNRQTGAPPASTATVAAEAPADASAAREGSERPAAPQPPGGRSYHEIPLRRRAPASAEAAPASATPPAPQSEPPRAAPSPPAPFPDRRDIPLRRRGAAAPAFPVARSGAGDVGHTDRLASDERRPSAAGRVEPVTTRE
ncbi:MAG: hypothetical protein RMK84_07275 [Oscillochloridaceae bacterium]|nr:hypothetical protein [Chloroflexaceae bacterium]MDW8389909.1 hypothetical protein [Oscillochloridaceae bacterium]